MKIDINFASNLQTKVMDTQKYCYKYPHPAVTADSIVFGFDGKDLFVLLIKRGETTYQDCWAIPGGFMKIDETIEECARRELAEETMVEDVYLEQFHVFSAVDRDPRERVMTVAFLALVRKGDYSRVVGGDDAEEARWFKLSEVPQLAFDHNEIIHCAHEELKRRLRSTAIAFRLLDKMFTIPELQALCEAVNCTTYDNRNFYKKTLAFPFIEHRGTSPVPQPNKRPELYTFNESAYKATKARQAKYPFDF